MISVNTRFSPPFISAGTFCRFISQYDATAIINPTNANQRWMNTTVTGDATKLRAAG